MKCKSNGKHTYTPAEIQDWVARFRASGLGLKRFAQKHRLSGSRLHYWVYHKSGSPPEPRTPGVPGFHEIKLVPGLPGMAGWAAAVSLPTGVTVRVREGVPTAWLGEILHTLGRSC